LHSIHLDRWQILGTVPKRVKSLEMDWDLGVLGDQCLEFRRHLDAPWRLAPVT
jgi:hypothetical protein